MFSRMDSSSDVAHSRQAGFSLVELLVVIGIIAILAGLLLPSLARGKRTAETVVCLNNLKQFACAWHLYADDYEQRIAPNYPRMQHYPTAAAWVGGLLNCSMDDWPDNTNTLLLTGSLLAPYLGRSIAIWRCPGDHSQSIHSGRKYPRVRSYSMNFHVNSEFYIHGYATGSDRGTDDGSTKTPSYIVHRMSDFISPSGTFVFLDERSDSISDCTFWFDVYGSHPTVGGSIPADYHNQAGNLVFGDGHAERHRWMDARTMPPIRDHQFTALWWDDLPPIRDFPWLKEHARAFSIEVW